MNFKLDTPFLEAFEELDRLNEATDINASKKFWAAAKNKQIDEEAFHAAYDDELKELGLMDVFTADGAFTSKGVYGRIKAAKEANPDSWAIKALTKLWALRYVDNVKFASEQATDKTAEEEAQRKAEQKRQEEETVKAAKEQQFKAHQELLKTYISKVDTKLVTAYEQAAGIPAVEGIYLTNEGAKYGLAFKGWDRYYPITITKLEDESAMLELLDTGITAAVEAIRTKKFKDIDVFKVDKYATVILLGESGTLYELSSHGFTNSIQVSIDGGEFGPTDIITEPYEVIYARTNWSGGNYSTRRDSHSAIYYSWNSKHAAKLGNRIPTEYGRDDSYFGSYVEVSKVENPSSKYYSHADGIDSWAERYSVVSATD